jgi:hypothetical protein
MQAYAMTNDFEYPGEQPPDDLVTIGEVDSQPEFLVIRSLLESAGIECYSPNVTEYYVKGKNAPNAVIPVQVRASQAEDAIALLKDAESHPLATDEPDNNQRR